jgi:putative transposase
VENELITPHEEWMALGADQRARCAAYRALFDDVPEKSQIEQIRSSNRKGLPLGRDSFKSRIETQSRSSWVQERSAGRQNPNNWIRPLYWNISKTPHNPSADSGT